MQKHIIGFIESEKLVDRAKSDAIASVARQLRRIWKIEGEVPNLISRLSFLNDTLYNGHFENSLGCKALKSNDLVCAFEHFTKAIIYTPGIASFHVNRATVYYRNRDYDSAIEDCEAAIKQEPNCARAYCVLSASHWRRDGREKARKTLLAGLRFCPGDQILLGNLNALEQKGSEPPAVCDADERLVLNKDDVELSTKKFMTEYVEE